MATDALRIHPLAVAMAAGAGLDAHALARLIRGNVVSRDMIDHRGERGEFTAETAIDGDRVHLLSAAWSDADGGRTMWLSTDSDGSHVLATQVDVPLTTLQAMVGRDAADISDLTGGTPTGSIIAECYHHGSHVEFVLGPAWATLPGHEEHGS